MSVSLQAIEAEIARRQQAQQPTAVQPVAAVSPSIADIDAEIARRQQAQPQDQTLLQQAGDVVASVAEPVATVASAIVAEPIAGLAGIGSMITGADPAEATKAIEATREALTFQPRTEAGQAGLQAVGEVVAPIGEAFEAVSDTAGDFVFDLTGSPALAAAAATTPAAILEGLGLGAIRKARAGTKLIDESGRPTLELEKILDEKGLNFDNLSDTAKAEIPNVVPPGLLPAPSAEAAKISEKALVKQIESGARDNALAPLKVVGNKVQPDKLGIEAIKQGFEEGFVQAVKTANPQTKKGFGQMLDMMKRITKNRRLGLDFRPSNVAGDSVSSRIRFIRDTANDARKQLNDIATNELKGKTLNVTPVVTRLESALDDIDVKLVGDGLPKPDFAGSLISKDKTSQRVIKDLIDLMGEGGQPDALRFHKLKRQIDNMIDFRKKSAGGLSDAGRNVLKDIRSSLNESIRGSSSEYARVNDIMSQSIGALDDFQNVAGSSIDIFGKGSNAAIGQDLRGLMSNRKSRIKLENALDGVEETAKNLGGKFSDDVKDLVLFANGLEDRFGAIAETSFKGEIESAIRQAGTQGLASATKEKAFKAASERANRLRGINDFNAFKSMGDLIKKGGK